MRFGLKIALDATMAGRIGAPIICPDSSEDLEKIESTGPAGRSFLVRSTIEERTLREIDE